MLTIYFKYIYLYYLLCMCFIFIIYYMYYWNNIYNNNLLFNISFNKFSLITQSTDPTVPQPAICSCSLAVVLFTLVQRALLHAFSLFLSLGHPLSVLWVFLLRLLFCFSFVFQSADCRLFSIVRKNIEKRKQFAKAINNNLNIKYIYHML